MDEKSIYQIYVGLMKLHRKYAAQDDKRQCLPALVTDVNQMNAMFNYNFCNAMTDILRRWCINGFHGLDVSSVAQFYTELWRFHKKYIEPPRNDAYWQAVMEEVLRLDEKYGLRQLQEYMQTVMDELENSGVAEGNGSDQEGNGSQAAGNDGEKDAEATAKK